MTTETIPQMNKRNAQEKVDFWLLQRETVKKNVSRGSQFRTEELEKIGKQLIKARKDLAKLEGSK